VLAVIKLYNFSNIN